MRNSAKLLEELGVFYSGYYLDKYKHLNELKPIYSKVWNFVVENFIEMYCFVWL